MNRLTNKRILLGVTGSIAAYKSAELIRRLRDAGADVQVVMTRAASDFITPLTLQTLSDRPVRQHLLDTEGEATMGHITLARWADAVVIAPASANFLSKLAQGQADDLLSTLCLASSAPLIVAPAMNRLMWESAATQDNIKTLLDRGVEVFGPDKGEQACGEVGAGRMLEPLALSRMIAGKFETGVMSGLSVLISAGPTCEDIDPVRFISNRSSGKMGYAIAQAVAEAGARVTLVSGPVVLDTPERVERVDVRSGSEMLEQIESRVASTDIFISAAAVADYRPVDQQTQKIKKHEDLINLALQRTEDILARVAAMPEAPFTVGFAAETEDLEVNATTKLREKSLDMIAANLVGQPERGFDSDNNELTVYWDSGSTVLVHAPKDKIARELVTLVAERYHAKHSTKNH